MLSDLRAFSKVVGVKQSHKVIQNGQAAQVYVALDAEQLVIAPVYALCEKCAVPLKEVATMAELGDAAGIDVGAAVVAILK